MTKKIEDIITVITPENCFDTLRSVACDNLAFFKNEAGEMSVYLTTIMDSIDDLAPLVEDVEAKAHAYNFSEEVKGNGYTSWVKNAYGIACHTLKILEEVTASRNSYFFRKDHYLKEVKTCSEAVESMCVIMNYLLMMMSWSESSHDLILIQEKHDFVELMSRHTKYINLYCFFGRCLCFQYCDSMATILRALNILMASFSEVYYNEGHIIDPILRGSKYWLDPEVRAKRVVNISQYGSADFCKNFWFLGEIELMQRIPSIMLPTIQVNKVINLEPEPLVIENIYGKNVNIPIPSSHIGIAPISVRLMSFSLRIGMEAECSSKSGYKYPSDTLVFHCHGGGFVAQSSRSHENYLRQWAIDFDAPILSVDYALAPEAPYPRALEEVFYVYCWALANASLLGTTAEKVVLAGDSAGANLNLALTMMCLEYGVKKPKGIFMVYVPVILSMDLSPSRLLTLIDPLLPAGFLLAVTKAYTCSSEVYAKSLANENKLRRKISKCGVTKASESPDENGHINKNLDQDPTTSEGEDEASKPKLMSRSNSTGVLSRWITSLSTKLAALSPSKSFSDEAELEDELAPHLPFPLDMLMEFKQDPYFSPYYASDSILMNFPPLKILTTDMDPFLDDCIMFAKKMKKLGVPTSMEILPGLCHGFLNFSMLSNEAYEGSKVCSKRISELINEPDPVIDASPAIAAEESL